MYATFFKTCVPLIFLYFLSLKVWRRKLNKDAANIFLILHQFLTANELDLSQDTKSMFEGFAWIQDPFDTCAPRLKLLLRKNIIELS